VTERGLLESNLVEDSLWVFRTGDIVDNVKSGTNFNVDRALAIRMTAKNSPVIYSLAWLDESNMVFRAQTKEHKFQLLKANARTGTVEPISRADQDVGMWSAFDVRNGNAVYTVVNDSIKQELEEQNRVRPAKVVVGRLEDVLDLPESDGGTSNEGRYDWRELWAVINGNRFRVDTTAFQNPLHLSPYVLAGRMALSPDGRFAVVPLPASTVPEGWSRYSINKGQPFFSKFTAGPQDLSVRDTGFLAYQFVLIDLFKGTAKALFDAPIGSSGGYHRPRPVASWSADGEKIALVNTYLPIERDGSPLVPCVAVFTIATGKTACVETLTADRADGRGERFSAVTDLHFDSDDGRRLIFSYINSSDAAAGIVTYQETQSGTWSRTENAGAFDVPVEVMVQESLNDPPKLVAIDRKTGASIDILDLNGRIRAMNLGVASEYRWKDDSGRDWLGGLVRPPDYVPGRRYPLVIQTHGFLRNQFMASGLFTTAFAARPLAAAGIVVLQVNDQVCGLVYLGSPEESECGKSAYEAAVKQLTRDGIVDPDKVGIIGFSQTGLYTMATLTDSTIHFSAATLSDASVGGYFEFVSDGPTDKQLLRNDVGRIGAEPFGTGLQKWFINSPVFNMDRVSTPIRFEGVGPRAICFMWEPYALLRYLGKPAEMIQLDLGTHPLSNPAERLASQGGTVDWFRFWLKGEEDPDPAKASQYARWHELRKLQETKTAAPHEN